MEGIKLIFSVFTMCFFICCNHTSAAHTPPKSNNETWTLTIYDSYGDGWNGASISLSVNAVTQISHLTIENGSRPVSRSFEISCGDVITTSFFPGEDDDECSFVIKNANNVTIITENGPPNNIEFIYDCSSGGSVWTGQIDSDWNHPRNWNSGEVPSAFQNVIIPAATNMPIIYSGETGDCFNLLIESGAQLSIENNSSFITNGEITNHGNVQIEKSIESHKWHLFSTPVNSVASITFTDDYLQDWDEGTGTWREIIGLSTYLASMEGYGLYPTSKRTYIFNGTPHTGVQTHRLFYTDYSTAPQSSEGANLVGNPYPSSIDWSYLDDNWGAVYTWNPDYNNGDGTYGKYMSWNNGNSTNGGSQYIAPMQAFFIVVEEEDNDNSLVLNNNYRTHAGASEYFKSKSKNKKGFVLQALTNGSSDELHIQFNENSSLQYEKQYDALKLFSNSLHSCQLFSISGDKFLSIDVRPETEHIQLGLRNQKSGQYDIALKESDGTIAIELEDTKTHTFHDMKNGPYRFNWNPNDSEERFILHLQATGTEEMEAQDAQVYAAAGQVYVRLDQPEDYQEIVFYDLAGRLVYESKLSTQSLQNFDLSAFSGALLVQLRGTKKNRTKKVVLN